MKYLLWVSHDCSVGKGKRLMKAAWMVLMHAVGAAPRVSMLARLLGNEASCQNSVQDMCANLYDTEQQ